MDFEGEGIDEKLFEKSSNIVSLELDLSLNMEWTPSVTMVPSLYDKFC